MVMTQLSFRHSGTSDFQKLSPHEPYESDKLAHYFFLIVYDMSSWKASNISIIFHIDNFVFSVSRNDAYYQSDQNAPDGPGEGSLVRGPTCQGLLGLVFDNPTHVLLPAGLPLHWASDATTVPWRSCTSMQWNHKPPVRGAAVQPRLQTNPGPTEVS